MARPTSRRPLLVVPVLALSLLALPTAGAEETVKSPPPGEVVQTYSGAFVTPTRFADTAGPGVDGGWPGAGRKVYLAAQAADGIIADVFDVNAATWGGTFMLEQLTEQTGSGQLDVYFYGANLASVADGTPETTGEFDTGTGTGEAGRVPVGSRYGIVFSPTAVNPTFRFTATRRPAVDLLDLDGLTVQLGTLLGVTNSSSDYATITHVVSGKQKQLINRSGQGDGLRAGETVDITFPIANNAVGSYVFQTSAGTKTVTVVK